MRVLILVGGLGTRLRPLTNSLPKPLLPIAGEPLMTRTLRRLQRQGVREVIIAVQYLADQFRTVYGAGSGRALGLDLQIVEEPQPLGTAGAIRFALEQTGQLAAGPTIVLNGDELTDLDVSALMAHHQAQRCAATIAIRSVPDPSAFGVVVCDADGRVLAFQEKPAQGMARANTINSGAYVLEPQVIAHIPVGQFSMVERDLFPALLDQHIRVAAFLHSGYSQDIGTLPGYLAANKAVLMGQVAAELPLGQAVAPGVWVGDDVVVHPTATLVAPIMLGAGTVVGADSYLEQVVTWERVSIGTDATVREAVLAADSAVSSRAQVAGIALDKQRTL